jgi:hypothetical protein
VAGGAAVGALVSLPIADLLILLSVLTASCLSKSCIPPHIVIYYNNPVDVEINSMSTVGGGAVAQRLCRCDIAISFINVKRNCHINVIFS